MHARQFIRGEGATLPAHRAALVAAVSGKRGKRYLKRQLLLDLGEPALVFLTEVVHRRPRQWTRDVDHLHELLQVHGPEPLRRALSQSIERQIFEAPFIQRVLKGRLPLEGGIQ